MALWSIFLIPRLCPTSSCRPCLCSRGIHSLPDSFSGSLLPLTPSAIAHRGRRGCVAAFYLWFPWGGGALLGLFLASAGPSHEVSRLCLVSLPPPTPLSHPLLPQTSLSAFVSFLPPFLSFSLSSLGALCSCLLFVSASLLSAPSAPSPPFSSSEKLSTSRASIFQGNEVGSQVQYSEVPKPEKEAEPDVESHSDTGRREAAAMSRSGWRPDAESQGRAIGVRGGTERFEEVLAISPGIYSGLDYLLPSQPLPQRLAPGSRPCTVVPDKRKGGVIALESVHVIDARETVLVEGLRVASWEGGKDVARQHPGVKVAQLGWDDQLCPRELKKYRLITKQARTQRHTSCCRPPSSATSFRAGPSSRTGSPTGLVRVAKGLEWRGDSRAYSRVLTLCTRRFPVPHGGGGTWRYLNSSAFGSDDAQVQSQLFRHLQRQAPRLAGLTVMCQLFLAPQLWSQLADFCQAGLGLEMVKGDTKQYLLEANI